MPANVLAPGSAGYSGRSSAGVLSEQNTAARRPMQRELAAAIAKLSRPPAQPVAGYDLTFSPVKSVSALWAVADPADRSPDRAGPPGRGHAML